MNIYTLTASQLSSLLQILGALVLDYTTSPTKPMSKDIVPFVKSPLGWKDLPSLQKTINTCIRGGDKIQALYDLGQELKQAIPTFHRNKEYTTQEITMLKAFRAYLSTDSESALNYIRKNASMLGTKLAVNFEPQAPKSDHVALSKTVKSLVGREAKHLTRDEAELAKDTNPTMFDKYKTLRKAHTEDFKASLMNFVRQSGKKLVSYKEAYDWAIKSGFTHSMVPGFDGQVDDQGRWYTKKGEIINGVPNLVTYSHVVMNDGSDPGAEWIFKAMKPEGGWAYAYTANFKRDQSFNKFQHVAELMQSIDHIRSNWLKKVQKFDITSKLSVSAVVLEILYSFAARVGSAPGRGVGTLLVKNFYLTQQGVNLAYLGKDSIPTKHIIKTQTSPISAAVVRALVKLREDKTPQSFLFTIEPVPGKFKKVTPADINAAFHQFGASKEVTVHKLRTCRGTALFAQLVEKDAKSKRPPVNEREAKERYTEMTEKVGKLLNHRKNVGGSNETVTGTTAALNYIDSSIQCDLFDRWGFRVPIALEKLLALGEDQ